MAEIIPRHIFFGALVLMLLLMGGMAYLNEINGDTNRLESNEKYLPFQNKTQQKYETVSANLDSLESEFSQEAAQEGAFGFLDNLVRTSWTSIKGLFSTFDFMKTFLQESLQAFGLGSYGWVVVLLFGFIIVIVGFSIFSAIFQKDV